MYNFTRIVRRIGVPIWTVLLAWGLLALPAAAQTAPTWQQAFSGNALQPTSYEANSEIRATAADGAGNVYVVGRVGGDVTFGTVRLPLSGGNVMFLAKWSTVTNSWVWAIRSSDAWPQAIAVSGSSVYVTGFYQGATCTFGATTLTNPSTSTQSSNEFFVAKWTDNGSSATSNWAYQGTSSGQDQGNGIAVSGTSVYVTGSFSTLGSPFTVAGTTLTPSYTNEAMFTAKYTDNGATATGNWAAASSGSSSAKPGVAKGKAIAVSGSNVYITGEAAGDIMAGGTLLRTGQQGQSGSATDIILAKYTDNGSSATGAWGLRGGGDYYDTGNGVAVDGSSVYITGEYTYSVGTNVNNPSVIGGMAMPAPGFGGSNQLFVASFTDNGTGTTSNWLRTSSSSGAASNPNSSANASGNAITTSGGDVYVAGEYYGTTARIGTTNLPSTGGNGGDDPFVVKYTASGSQSWVTSAGSSGTDHSSGGVVVSGGSVFAGLYINDNGTFNTTPVTLTPKNVAVLCQLTTSDGSWQRAEFPLSGGRSITRATATDAAGNVFVTGSFSGSMGFGSTVLSALGSGNSGSDIFLAKWSPSTNAWVWAVRAGGAGLDVATGIAVRGNSVYLTGSFEGTATSPATIAGTALTSAGNTDVFVAKYTDNGSSASANWAVAGGGTGADAATGIAASGSALYVSGSFTSATGASIAGTALAGAGGTDAFVAKYTDNGSSASGNWAVAGGGTGADAGAAVAVSGTSVYLTGSFTSTTGASLAGTVLTGAGSTDMFVAKWTDNGSSAAAGWVASGGGPNGDAGTGIAASGSAVYVAGQVWASNGTAIAGTAITNGNNYQMFVAKYTDNGATGSGTWVKIGGGTDDDGALAVAVSGSNVYVTGRFSSNTGATFAGTALAGSSSPYNYENFSDDVFLAKYVDAGATATDGGAVSGGGPGADAGRGVAVGGSYVYVAGEIMPSTTAPSTFGSSSLSNPTGIEINFLGQVRVGTPPTITSFTPASGPVGTSVTINGTGFTGTTGVSFNGTAATGFTVGSDTQLTVSVPSGATTGVISLTTPSGTASTAGSFVVTLPVSCTAQVTVTPTGPVSLPGGGSVTLTAQAVEPAFNAAGFTGLVYTALRLPNGQVLVGGSFQAYNGVNVPRGLIRLNADGSRDLSFNGTNSGFINGIVRSLAVQADGKILVAGDINSYNNAATPWGVIRLNDDGSRDTGFNGSNAGFNVAGGNVLSVALQPDGKVLVGGNFITYNAVSVPRGVVRLNTDGSRDTSFNGSNSGVNGGTVHTLAVQPDGKILIGGIIFDYNGEEPSGTIIEQVPNGLIRLNPNGSRDATFNAYIGVNAGFNRDVISLALQPDGKVLVGGAFSMYNNADVPDGLVRLNANGSYDASFNGANVGTAGFTMTPGQVAVGQVFALALQADGKVLAGGAFRDYNKAEETTPSQPVPNNLIRLNADGSRDMSFNGSNSGLDNYVYALDLLTSGRVLVGGFFTAYNGNAATPDYLFALNADGSPNTAATPVAGATYTWTPGNTTGPTLTVTQAGSYTATASYGSGCTITSAPVQVTSSLANLTVSSPQNISGSYNNVTITGTGTATLTGPLKVAGTLMVQSGGSLLTSCQPLRGNGSFELQAGATLGICDVAGIRASSSDTTGAIRLTGTRSFSPDATYRYTGSQAQVTGSGLPAQVRSLEVSNAAGLRLSQPVAVAQVLRLSTGDLSTNGQTLTLLSAASGTALVDNTGGVVNGTVTVQRYISPALNPGTGYRHLSAPVANTTVADLSTSGFAPVVNPSYNTSATPNQVTPFPTVFGYDQARQATSPASAYSPFDKGWVSPATLADALQPGRGYTVNLAAAQTVDFVGQLNAGTLPLSFVRGAGADAGWQLVGNPYPAPLDWSRVPLADRRGLTGAMYVFESAGAYTGRYRSYVNGIGNPVLPLGQAFFVRVADTAATGSLVLRDAHRLTAPDATPLLRTTADLRPQLQLQLLGAGTADVAYVYFEAGATNGVDAEFDAHKLPNSTGLNLAALAGTRPLAVSGLPLLTTATVVPLQVAVPSAGTYSLQAAQLLNFAPGTQVYLHDALTGQEVSLQSQPTYSFTHSAAAATGRFSLVFRPSGVTATASARPADQLSVFPNPTTGSFTLRLPAAVPGKQAEAVLSNTLGQVVRRQTVAVLATGVQAEFNAAGLPAGVYTLRLALADGSFLTKRIVKQ